jgi:hypothetical protein
MWTEAWRRVLARPDALGEVARSSLWGLTAQLRRAAEARPEQDDGRFDCQQLLDALGELAEVSGEHERLAAVPVPAQGPRLAGLAREFLADADLARVLGRTSWETDNASDTTLWSLILMGLLRAEETIAARWRARVIHAASAAGLVPAPPSCVVPLPPWPPSDDQGVLGPDLTLTGARDSEGPIAIGIRFDDDEPIDARFAPAGSCEADLVLLARIAASYATLTEVDDQLWHAPARSSVLRELQGEERAVYLNRLADGFHAVLAAETRFAANPNTHNAQNLVALWLDLDETYHSLVPLPLCAETSWWSRTKNAARGVLLGVFERIRVQGVELDLAYRVLKGPYEGVSAQSARDIRLSGQGPPGQVAACLRVYVESAWGPRPGRVIFIPP